MTVWIFRTVSPRKYKDKFIIAINSLTKDFIGWERSLNTVTALNKKGFE